jgi:hypothetical protein
MSVTLTTLASQETHGTHQTTQDVHKFHYYCASHPIQYKASNMILKVHLDTSYNSEPKAKVSVGGHFYMGNKGTEDDTKQGAILAATAIMQPVLSSTSETESAPSTKTQKRLPSCTSHWREWPTTTGNASPSQQLHSLQHNQ